MAETMKTSRIVSGSEEDDLEEALMEEFNMRLKTCMSQDNLQDPPEALLDQPYEDIQPIKTNSVSSQDFIRAEQESYYEIPLQNGHHQSEAIYENVTHQSKTEPPQTDQYVEMSLSPAPRPSEQVAKRPDLTLTDLSELSPEPEVKSVKDRMFLSTDVAPCLLFTQTVTSPMLTPSEENIDFLKGFQNGDVITDIDEAPPKLDEAIYENAEFLKNNGDVIYENLKEGGENIYENLKDREVYEIQDGGELKSVDIVRQLNCQSSQVTESYVETTTIESNSFDTGGLKKKKTKKSRKEEKENISVKSSFNKFDALQKKNVLHVRSSDSSKAQEKFNGATVETSNCKACDKTVFQMEQVKAVGAIWHRNCFRCSECKKQLSVDGYESHEANLYCKPHFKSLFAPKVVEDEQPSRPRKPELIIRENEPVELPPDVVRASDKPDLGLEELQKLNVKERFQVFEHYQQNDSSDLDRTSAVNVKRSPSILSKLAKFQAKGMDIGVADDSLNGIPIEESSSEEEEEEEGEGVEGEDADLVRAKKVHKEKPFHFTNMSDVKSKWENGEQLQEIKDERREERKQEIQSIRSKLFLGKQVKMKEAYQQAIIQSESSANLWKEPIEALDTKSLKERFEKGEVVNTENVPKERGDEDVEVYESEISKKSRSLFLELDANASKAPQMTPTPTPKMDVRKAREVPTPDREVYRDPEVVRSEEVVEDSIVAKESHTATKMLSKFRQMEENLTREPQPGGLKPLKRFTPPPEPSKAESNSEGSGSEEEEEEEDQTDRGKVPDDDLLEAQKAARAKQLRAKFERWEASEIKKEQNSINIIEEGDDQSQIESTRSLRARFESMRGDNSIDTSRQVRVKPNRFVEFPSITETCASCNCKVYPLEKISVHNHIYHKTCFKCMECSCILRMDSYSYNQGLLYCTPHFKRLFISKGNYDSAFGLDQHKEKWNTLA